MRERGRQRQRERKEDRARETERQRERERERFRETETERERETDRERECKAHNYLNWNIDRIDVGRIYNRRTTEVEESSKIGRKCGKLIK